MAAASVKPPSVAFLGLGAMGFAMSTHLVRQGIPVIGFDIWKPTLEKFEKACQDIPGAIFSTTTSAAEAVKSASIIILMVATHHHVNAALFDSNSPAVKNTPKDGTIIIASTVPPRYPIEVRQRLDTEFGRPDLNLIDAPVSGGTVGSSNGTLTIMRSSDNPKALADSDTQFVMSNLSSNGKTLFTIPGGLGAGTSAKALNQVQCGIHIVCGSELMALAALNNLNTKTFYDAMRSQDPTAESSSSSQIKSNQRKYGWTWMFENRGPRMLDPNLPISSAISIINKDVGIIKEEEDRLNITLPLLNQAHAILAETMNAGMASIDDAYISRFYLGLNSPREQSVVSQASESTIPNSGTEQEQQSITNTLLIAHAMINFQSAYETFLFGEALDLRSDTQRQMWFTIIAGAAGASRVFGEVIPVALEAVKQGKDWKDGFRSYAVDIFGGKFKDEIDRVAQITTHASAEGVQARMLETALAFVKSQLN